jgi:hypothetical protein
MDETFYFGELKDEKTGTSVVFLFSQKRKLKMGPVANVIKLFTAVITSLSA